MFVLWDHRHLVVGVQVCVLMSHLPSFGHLCRLRDHHIIFVYESA